jgi:16S rRNA C967 or C1407 C5-methylase (RsmB/RsmF family)
MDGKVVSQDDLERLLRDAESAHAAYETELGTSDDNWPAWYARYIFERLPETPWQDYAQEPEKLPSTEPYLSE